MVHPLKAYRLSHGLSQEGLAAQLGVKRITVWRWENYKREPNRHQRPAISQVTGIPADKLLIAEDSK